MVEANWQSETLGALARAGDIEGIQDGNHGNEHPKSADFVEQGVPFVMANNLTEGQVDLTHCAFLRREQADRLRIGFARPGDILLSHKGTVGSVAIVPAGYEYIMLTPQVTYYRVAKKGRLHARFLFYAFQEYGFQSWLKRLAFQSTRSYIGITEQKKRLRIPLPPLVEQAKIGEILSTWDQAIETTEKLIENSKTQKKALMQQLLTGKKRLPGFSNEWSETVLKNIAAVFVSPVNKKSVVGEPAVRLCNYTDVYYNSHITNSLDFMTATASNSQVERFTLMKNDLVITKDSETPGDIAVPALVTEELDGVVCGYHLAIIRPDVKVLDGAFLNHLFSQPKVRHYFSTRANGATRFGLTIDGIKEASFMLPGIEEQQKIAGVLDTCDQELGCLRIVLQQSTTEKRALMQQLLTGKRRVKVAA